MGQPAKPLKERNVLVRDVPLEAEWSTLDRKWRLLSSRPSIGEVTG